MKNTLTTLFDQFNKQKIKYCIRGRYKHLPETLDKGDVDLLINNQSWQAAKQIIKSQFYFYPHTQPNLFYYYHDDKLGLIQLDILITKKFPQTKTYKNFQIPKNEKPIPNKKTLIKKIKTSSVRKLHYFLRGKLIVFEGPDGSGKTTNLKSLYNSLEKLPIKKEIIHFATKFKDKKPSALKRLLTRSNSILKTYRNIILGRITIADRYIYLTFRNSSPFLKKLLRFLAPTPDIIFITKAPIETIKKRKQGQRDNLSPKFINELYEVYNNIEHPNKIEINTQLTIKQNQNIMTNTALKTILK